MIMRIKHIVFFNLIFMSSVMLGQTVTVVPDDEFPKKVVETKLSEIVATDSLPTSELVQRAVNWVKVENLKYIKTSGASSGSKAECVASFPVKPKELNPQTDYTGKILMKVVIECKDSKYKYTVSQIKYISKSGKVTGGSIDNVVPECGSMELGDITWKKLKGEAIKGANMVVTDLKAAMTKPSTETATDEW
jgi:hypothetical protein